MIITVIGAEYVGLPLVIAFAKHHQVICFDINKKELKNC
jgi:UDP-N-acetyl-D-mannosaminuronate dehydrogenase